MYACFSAGRACVLYTISQEVEILTLCRDIVNNGPDLFSMHRVDLDASFR